MSLRWRIGLLLVVAATAASAEGPAAWKPLPPELASIRTVPVHTDRLSRSFDNPGAGDPGDEGAEKPEIVLYEALEAKDSSQLVVTDVGLCRRPEEKEVCSAFQAMLSGPRPAMGDYVTDSRIEDNGAATVYLAPLEGAKLAGVDRMTAFVGGVTQDAPLVEPYVYVYAQRGTNLLELSASLGACEFKVPHSFYEDPGRERSEAEQRRRENDYYRRACVTPKVLARARAAAQHLAELFRLAP